MKDKKTTLKELLFFFCDLCAKNGIEYSFVGEPALTALQSNSLPAQYNRLTVALPYGQIRKFMQHINEDSDSPYVLRYLLNDPTAMDFSYTLEDPDYQIIDLDNYETTNVFPVSLTIIELRKAFPPGINSKRFEKILQFVNSNTLEITDPKKMLRQIKWKTRQRMKGKEQFLEAILEERRRLSGLENWNEVCQERRVFLRNNAIPGEMLDNVQTVDIEGHKVSIAAVLTDKLYTKTCFKNMEAHPYYQMELGQITPELLNRSDIQDQLQEVLNERKRYEDVNIPTTEEDDVIQKMWQTYKMTIKVKEFEETFNEDRIREISNYLDENNLVAAKEALEPYIKAKARFKKKGITLINNQNIEPIVQRYLEMQI